MNDTPETPAPSTPNAPTPPIEIHMPSGRRRWVSKLLGTGLIVAILIIVYMGIILSATMAGPMETRVVSEGRADQTVAVYEVEGMITSELAADFATFVRTAETSETIKAAVIRVNSPGGEVAASDEMNAGVKRIRAAGKTVVVSMGGVAASGGYYLSAPAEVIYAEPTTITGSIGVISTIPILIGTLEKIGMDVRVIRSDKSEQHKANLNPVERPTAEAIAEHKALLNKIQDLFMAAVAEGRTMLDADKVAELSDGRVWLGAEAKQLQLVDEIGYLGDAVAKAASLAGLGEPRVVKYSLRKGLLAHAFGGARAGGVHVDAKLLDEIQTPRVLMIWRP